MGGRGGGKVDFIRILLWVSRHRFVPSINFVFTVVLDGYCVR